MQDYKAINSEFAVAGILSPVDLAKARTLGFSTIVNNLPDEEVANGFTSDIARQQAKSLGLDYIYLPVTGASLEEQENIDQFAQILSSTDLGVLAHCKTGTRSAILWGLASSQSSQPTEVLEQLESADFELDFLDDEFEEQWEIGLERSTARMSATPQLRPEIPACV